MKTMDEREAASSQSRGPASSGEVPADIGGTRLSMLRGWVGGHPVLEVFLLALVVRIAFAAGSMVLTGGTLFPDASGYDTLASNVAAGETSNWDADTEDWYNRHATLLLPLAFVYWAFGHHLFAGLVLVATFGAIAAAGVARLVLEILPSRFALGAGLVAAVFPSQVLWSAQILKDPASWALLVALGVIVAKAGKVHGWSLLKPALATCLLLILLFHVRIHTFIVAAWAVAAAAWFGYSRGRMPRGLGGLALALLLPWVFGAGIGGYTFVKNGAQHTEFIRTAMAYGAATAFVSQEPEPVDAGLRAELAELEDQVDVARGEGDEARAAKLEAEISRIGHELKAVGEATVISEDATKLRSDLAHLPKGLSVMLLEPYPWVSSTNPNVQLVRLEMLVWYPLLILAAIGLSRVWRYRRALAYPAMIGTGLVIIYALTEGNLGTAYRHRGEFVWVVITLAAVGAHALVGRRHATTVE